MCCNLEKSCNLKHYGDHFLDSALSPFDLISSVGLLDVPTMKHIRLVVEIKCQNENDIKTITKFMLHF